MNHLKIKYKKNPYNVEAQSLKIISQCTYNHSVDLFWEILNA